MSSNEFKNEDFSRLTGYFNRPEVVNHYARATANVGLWYSEEMVFTRLFQKAERLIDIGTGTGRIAFELADMGYEHVIGVDVAKEMIQQARQMNKILESRVFFKVENACQFSFEDNLFDGAIFGFNGLMQIPHRKNRRQAMKEILRIVRPGGRFVFTTHFRENPRFKKFWADEQKAWDRGKQNKELFEFGDRYEETDLGKIFIHVPSIDEIKADLSDTGWILDWEKPRSKIAKEPLVVREFSDECRFWVARKPENEFSPV